MTGGFYIFSEGDIMPPEQGFSTLGEFLLEGITGLQGPGYCWHLLPVLIVMSCAIFWLSQIFKIFENKFLMTSYFFLLSAYIPCPLKVTIFMVSFWSWISY